MPPAKTAASTQTCTTTARRAGRKPRAHTVFTTEANQASAKLMPYTPVTEATCTSGRVPDWVLASVP